MSAVPKGFSRVTTAPSVLADGLSVLTFRYFDTDNLEILPLPIAALNLPNIRRIAIGITVQGTGAGVQATFPLTMDVRVRNL